MPKAISIGAATNFEVLNSAEIENFTALKSFAAGAVDNVPQWENNAESASIVVPITDPKNSPSASKVVLQNNHVSDSNTNIVPRTKPSGFRLAILAALLICGVSGALYFIAGRSASGEPIQNQTVQSGTEPNSNTGQAAVVLDSSPAKVSEAALLENTEQAETKSPSSVKNVEKKVSGGKPITRTVTAEKPKNAPTAIETPRRRESQNRADTRPRVVVGDDDDEPASDIESIFTGRPSNQREIRRREEERRPQREEMSEEEFQEMRRQRRQERRRRQNEN